MFTSKHAFFFILGIILFNVSYTLTHNLILVPLIFSYAGSDFIIGVIQMSVAMVGIVISIKLATLSKKFRTFHSLYLIALGFMINFPMFIFLLLTIPANESFNITGLFSIFIKVIVSSSTILYLGTILIDRMIVDLIPSENRNAVYNIIPSIVAFMSIFTLPLGGLLIDQYCLIRGIEFNFIIAILCPIMLYLSFFFKNTKHVTT